ncbi:lysine transporter LysE [Halarcobacter ebronensis]|uniref:Lysine transporter LysE n=1 Tax=Halarcobacter ebronensis TaxID=1462615 RepID=A0A4Q0YFI3_9BACT|nr:LysE family translocator [Halarcobacter ebronensis]RXJ69337.1 lysine transporter LysE [Halarcobacter ebronensis]
MSTEFLITSLVVVLIPGTGVLYTVSAGLFIGARAAVFAAIGCTFGILPSLLASILGLAVVIHSSALAFQVIKYIGVAYLLYLSWSMWKNSNGLALKKEKSDERLFSVMMKGFLINILNPKLTLFFLAFIPQFLSSNSSSYTSEMLVLGLIFMFMTLVVFILYGLLATSVREYLINSEKISRYVQRVFAGTFALLGLKLAFTDR